jgi:hypothetical protein
MGRGNVFAAMETNVGIAHIVANDEQDVGLVGSGREHDQATEAE